MDNKKSFSDFLNFDLMITPTIMKVYYIVFSILGALGMLFTLMATFAGQMGGAGAVVGFIVGLIAAAVYLLFFRIVCEMMILLFKVYGELKHMREKQ